jgi:hypothetical protein
MYHAFFIDSSVYRHLGCFYFLAIVNSGVIDMSAQMSLQHADLISFGYICPVMGLLDQMVALFPFF